MASIYVLDFGQELVNMAGYTGFYRGPWHKKSTTNLTNKEFIITWGKEPNL